MITVALTGATGFIGNVLLRHLVDQGFQVRSLYRPSSVTPPLSSGPVQWQAGDLGNLDSLHTFVAGADAVVHCAGAVRGATLQQFRKVNTEGVARLLQAATAQGVPRFVLMSSLAAREPTLSDYASSKKQGEDVLLQFQGGISREILRPPAVYGPGDREMLPLLQLIKRGIVPIIGDKGGRFSLLYVDDLAEAVSCLLKAEPKDGQCFELHDGHPGGYSWQQVAAIASQLNGKEPRYISVPRTGMKIAALTNIALARIFRYQPMLTPGKVREIFHPDWVCDNTAIASAIGWQPRVLFRDGMLRLFY